MGKRQQNIKFTTVEYDIMNVKEKLGKRINELRIEKSLSQEKLALKANIDRAYMHLIEKGKTNVSQGEELETAEKEFNEAQEKTFEKKRTLIFVKN